MTDLKRLVDNMSEDTKALNSDLLVGKPAQPVPAQRLNAPTWYENPVLSTGKSARVIYANTGSQSGSTAVFVADKVMKITLANERPPSRNVTWSGIHHKQRTEIKGKIRALVQLALFNGGFGLARPFTFKVWIQFCAYMRHPQFDPGNPETKPYIDALQGLVITADDARYVQGVLSLTERDDKNPRVEILVGELPWGRLVRD